MDPSKQSLGKTSKLRLVLGTISGTHLFRRSTIWIWPVVAAILLLFIGWFIRVRVEAALKQTLAANLQALLDADVAALEIWLDTQKAQAVAIASDDDVRLETEQILELAASAEPGALGRELLQSEHLTSLRTTLAPVLEAYHFFGFGVIDPSGRMLAAMRDDPVGKGDLPLEAGFLDAILAGQPTVSRPFRSPFVLEDADGRPRANLPTMLAGAPLRDAQNKIVAALLLRIRPEVDFTRILSVARAGESGETYAFDANGLLLSQSRFDDELRGIGLLVDRPDMESILNVRIRDPQVNMANGERPPLRRAEQPLTRMAAAAIEGESGVDVDGYRDYRGVPVIGAWTWLPEYGMGVATEVDVAEAYRPVTILRYALWGLFALLVLCAAAIFAFTVVVARLQRQAAKASQQARQLGQYTLDEELGSGGMGTVYRAHHAMLQRPTAVKLLDVDKTSEKTIARFEREVRLTAQLNHPNTIAIYDYGRTPEGLFYYAMEYLDGLDLEELVKRYGRQPEGRCVSILRQVCESLNEAHGIGLIHRDIKPANIMVCRRGGLHDVVKVLDFGLVKAVDQEREVKLTASGTTLGTPLYMSPEAIQHPDRVDHRSDLYAIGAVGYFLVTGRPVFSGLSVLEVCQHHLSTAPEPPSKRISRPVSLGLERLLMECLAKDKNERPQTALELADALAACQTECPWSRSDAEAWWRQHIGDSVAKPHKTGFQNTAFQKTVVAETNDTA